MDTLRFLDILGFVVGLVYLILEYKASIWLWLASIIMPAIDMVLYYKPACTPISAWPYIIALQGFTAICPGNSSSVLPAM